MAGYFDGEGTLATYTVKGKPNLYYSLAIYNNVKSSLDYVQEITGCGTVQKRKAGTGEWVWRAHGARDLLALLTQLAPYLRVKSEKAEIVIADLTARYGSP